MLCTARRCITARRNPREKQKKRRGLIGAWQTREKRFAGTVGTGGTAGTGGTTAACRDGSPYLLGRGEERSTLNVQRSTLNNGEWEILTNELKRYEYAVGPTGQISYSAPAGFHDDCVMALALANHRRWETENCGHFLRLECGWRGRTAPLRVGGLRRERCLDGY